MYGFFEITAPTCKRRAFDGAEYGTIAEALAAVEAITAYAEVDDEFDAADVMTKGGALYAVERI